MKIQNKYFNDEIYTPDHIVKYILDWVKPSGIILEPFYGNGAFTKQIKGCITLNIKKGENFFNFNKKVDYIISNPPYSNFTQILEHSFRIADNVIYLIPLFKLFSSNKRLDLVDKYGSYKILRIKPIKEWSINFPLGAIWFKKEDE